MLDVCSGNIEGRRARRLEDSAGVLRLRHDHIADANDDFAPVSLDARWSRIVPHRLLAGARRDRKGRTLLTVVAPTEDVVAGHWSNSIADASGGIHVG